MKFLAHIPEPARKFITTRLYGDDEFAIPGWVILRDRAEQHLNEINQQIKEKTGYPGDLLRQKDSAAKHLESMNEVVAILERFAHDERMSDAYTLLGKEFNDGEQWHQFLYPAWLAKGDYSHNRDQVKQATILRDDIAQKSEELADLLRKSCNYEQYGLIHWPPEFYNVSDLLRGTDSYDKSEETIHQWRALRGFVVGDEIHQDYQKNENLPHNTKQLPEINYDALSEEGARSISSYAWRTAPSLATLLDTITEVARRFEPRKFGPIGAAIGKRERNFKTEYLRALKAALQETKIETTPGLINAIAIVANVALNHQKQDVTYDTVKKVFLNGKS